MHRRMAESLMLPSNYQVPSASSTPSCSRKSANTLVKGFHLRGLGHPFPGNPSICPGFETYFEEDSPTTSHESLKSEMTLVVWYTRFPPSSVRRITLHCVSPQYIPSARLDPSEVAVAPGIPSAVASGLSNALSNHSDTGIRARHKSLFEVIFGRSHDLAVQSLGGPARAYYYPRLKLLKLDSRFDYRSPSKTVSREIGATQGAAAPPSV
ncbi:hypothetical protein EDD17DRAFT_1516464 [Pisolithus thermaeus]|nr:hypothetical protein EV401DRAFT_1892138 [Pisolithus croceorrhizus]KAI6140073.1 hypothetical protein EDD17DRAFT_1516464 [Pisolithus thermaeus]